MRVGPNYAEPDAPVAAEYSESESPKIDGSSIVDTRWWRVFNDPELEWLIEQLLRENLTLKSAIWRINEARAIRNINAANLFPQSQAASGDFVHNQFSRNADGFFPFAPITTRNWTVGFDASWELDLWGRIRRSVEASEADLEATVKDYDFAVVTLIGEVASLYINIVSLDERLVLARKNVKSLEGSRDIAQKRFDAGRTSYLDVVQAKSNLATTQATIPQLELAQRQALNALAVLLAIPPSEISAMFPSGKKIPDIPETAMVGIPAELLMRRPDIRAAERQLAAQFEQIGIAEAEFYPTFVVSGNLGYQAAQFSNVLKTPSYLGNIAPGFRWNILNYGRLLNGVRVEESRVNQLCFEFKNKVLEAQRDVEDGILEFLKNKERLVFDRDNEQANRESLDLSISLYKEGEADFGRVFVVQSTLVRSQDQLVATKANIALGLIETYKALGGGWEIRFEESGGLETTPGMNLFERNTTDDAPPEEEPRDEVPRADVPRADVPRDEVSRAGEMRPRPEAMRRTRPDRVRSATNTLLSGSVFDKFPVRR